MGSLCCIKECDKPTVARGFCVNHYRMLQKHGSPVHERPLSAINRGLTPEQKFWKGVQKMESGCWHWTGHTDRYGYGRFQSVVFGIKVSTAHRFSHILHTGEMLTPDVLVMHSCDNRLCCNPDHLKSGTTAENTADMIQKGRHIEGAKIRAQKNAKLSDDQVRSILRDARPYYDIAVEYDVHPQTVLAIKSRTTRTDVQINPEEIVRNKRGARGEARSKTLTEDDVRAIRLSPAPPKMISQLYGISRQNVCDIRFRRSWKHVE